MDYKLLIPPIAGAIIGWITNYAAIKLLFRPHLPIDVFGFRIQGVIPKRRKEIARSIATAIEKELLSSEDLAKTLKNIDWKGEIERSVEEVVEHRFGSRLQKFPVVGLVSENLKYHIKYIITKEFVKHIEKKKGHLTARFTENIDVKEMVLSKIDNLDLKKFEGLLTEFIARELKHLEVLGAVMGFFIGAFQSLFIYLMRVF